MHPNDYLKLIDEIEKLAAELEALREVAEKHDFYVPDGALDVIEKLSVANAELKAEVEKQKQTIQDLYHETLRPAEERDEIADDLRSDLRLATEALEQIANLDMPTEEENNDDVSYRMGLNHGAHSSIDIARTALAKLKEKR